MDVADAADESATTLVVGLAGHVDHGKTSLVRALTGTDTDRLEEERRRGLTIELGFAHAELASGRTVSFVDVPGHERFVRTMASGVSGIDAAMLVVDAREGVREQTREHADILRMLGVRRVVAVVAKSDLVEGGAIRAAEEAVAALLGPSLHATVACSAKTGDGLERVRDALATLPAGERDATRGAPFRMPIDRAFTMRGSGTVVTGTVWQGTSASATRSRARPTAGRHACGASSRGARTSSPPAPDSGRRSTSRSTAPSPSAGTTSSSRGGSPRRAA